MPIRITGMNSGLDTEALVSELVSAYRMKSQKYVKAQKKLAWKQEIWKGLNSKVSAFYSKLTSLRYSAAYNMKTATVSDATKASVKASSSAINGSYTVKIKKMAKAGYLTGAKLEKADKSSVAETTKLSELPDFTNGSGTPGTITVNADGKTTDIAVDGNTTIADFVKSLNSAGVKASFDATHQRIYVASSKTGKDSDFSLTGSDVAGTQALYSLGLNVNSEADMAMYRNWEAYARNTDGGQFITYDASGVRHENGTYDSEKTKKYIKSLLDDVRQAPATIANNTAEIKYANAYKAVKDKEAEISNNSNLSSAKKDEFHALVDEKSLKDVYVDDNGNFYDKLADGTYTARDTNKTNKTEADWQAAGITLTDASTRLKELGKTLGFTKEVEQVPSGGGAAVPTTVVDESKINEYKSARETVASYEADPANQAGKVAVQNAYVDSDPNAFGTLISGLQTEISTMQTTLKENALLDNTTFNPENVTAKIENAMVVIKTPSPDLDNSIDSSKPAGTLATRVNGQDAVFEINDAEYTSTSNEITVNGLTVSALAETGNDTLSVTVGNNTQGLYDKIKGILKDYNELINEMTKLYNAGSSRGYEPLTSEEKDAMTDTEVEEWEKKIKDSLLRRDDSLSSLLSGMTSAMMKSYNINGKNYSLSSFGIHTLGILNSADNEQNAYHIDGDADDTLTSGNADKLMAALTNDPDAVIDFMKQLTSGVYDVINKKMSSTTLSSFNYVYNDKQMAREYSDYTKTIAKWEEKLQKMEDSYYQKFAAMEKALATLQSQQNSLANLFA